MSIHPKYTGRYNRLYVVQRHATQRTFYMVNHLTNAHRPYRASFNFGLLCHEIVTNYSRMAYTSSHNNKMQMNPTLYGL